MLNVSQLLQAAEFLESRERGKCEILGDLGTTHVDFTLYFLGKPSLTAAVTCVIFTLKMDFVISIWNFIFNFVQNMAMLQPFHIITTRRRGRAK